MNREEMTKLDIRLSMAKKLTSQIEVINAMLENSKLVRVETIKSSFEVVSDGRTYGTIEGETYTTSQEISAKTLGISQAEYNELFSNVIVSQLAKLRNQFEHDLEIL